MLGVQDTCILYRQRLVSARLRLRGVTIGACHPATVAPQHLRIVAGYAGDSLYVRGVATDVDFGFAITLSAGLGWVAFLPRDLPLTGWEQKVAFLVFGCLGLPLGFLALRSLQSRAKRSHPPLTILVLVAALYVALSVVPALMGVPNAGAAAISGTIAGVLVGFLAQRLPYRLR
jgi:hypothetical protein